MRYHRHGNLSTAITWGLGLAIGFLLFKIFVILVAFATWAIWRTTKNCTAFWRRAVRASFVITLTVIVVLFAAMIFAE